jgi:hypothetical protein
MIGLWHDMNPNNAAYVMTWISAPLALFSLLFARWGFGQSLKAQKGRIGPIKIAQVVILTAWVVLPPVWFWIEYFRVYPNQCPKPTLEEFKYGQDVASKIWVGLVTVLFGLYFGKDLRNSN